MRPVLNAWLRWTERPHMARAETPEKLRRPFELKARLFFHGPCGSRYEPAVLDGSLPVLHVSARGVKDGPILLYFHGGGYIFGSPNTHKAMLARLSAATGLRAVLPDYRKAPEHPFPAAVEDALAVYRELAEHPGGVILGGDSAGGGLALALLGEILRTGQPIPVGVFAFSPLTDLTFSGESFTRNAASDVVLPAERAHELVDMYLAGQGPDDPRASPLFADFAGACPVWLCAGDTEFLLDDTRRLASRLRAEGVPVTEVIERDLPHVWPIFHNFLPEARRTLDELGQWIRSLSSPPGDS